MNVSGPSQRLIWHRQPHRPKRISISDQRHRRCGNLIMSCRPVLGTVVLLAVMFVGGCSSRPFGGPINQGFKPPVVAIVPTQERQSELNTQIREYVSLSRTGVKALRGCQILTDREALEADLSGKSLVVYGTPSGNAFLAKHMS